MTKLIALAALTAVALTFSSCAKEEQRRDTTATTTGSVSYAK